VAGDDEVGDLAGAGEVERQQGRERGGAALQEQHVVVVRDRHQFAQVALGGGGAFDEGGAAVADLHHRGPFPLPLHQFSLDLAQDGLGQRGGAGAEIEGA
jgi:hypothetical protein